MKHSPFAFFRRHQRVGMVILTVMAMFAFVFLDQTMRGVNNASHGSQMAVKIKGGDLTYEHLGQLIIQRSAVNRFIQAVAQSIVEDYPKDQAPRMVAQQVMQQQFGQEFAPLDGRIDSETNVMWGHVMRLEAKRMGMSVNDYTVESFVNRLAGDKYRLSADRFHEILNAINLKEKHLYDYFKEEILAKMAFNALFPRITQTPDQYWGFYKRLKVQQNLEIAALPVSEFAKSIDDPSDRELQTLFDTHKTRFSKDGPEFWKPGFRQPTKVRLQYLTASFLEAEDRVKAGKDKYVKAVTEKDIVDYYEKNKDKRYVDLTADEVKQEDQPLDPSITPEKPETPETTKPGEAKPKAAEGDKPGTKPTDPPASKPAEKSAGDKPAAPATEKPAEKPAAKPEVKPEAKPESKPEEKPEEKPEAKPEPKAEAKPEAKSEEAAEKKPCGEDPAAADKSSEETPKAEDKPKTEEKPKAEEAKPEAKKPAADKAPEETPKTEPKPKVEAKPEAKPADAKTGDKPAPASDKPDAAKPDSAKPADEKPGTEKPGTEKPSTEKPAKDGEKPAEQPAKADAKPEIKPPKYKPLTPELKDKIREELEAERTDEALKLLGEDAHKRLEEDQLKYSFGPSISGDIVYIDFNDDGDLDDDEPFVESPKKLNTDNLAKVPQELVDELHAKVLEAASAAMKSVGEKLGMKYEETDLFSIRDLESEPGLEHLKSVVDIHDTGFQGNDNGKIAQELFGSESRFHVKAGKNVENLLCVYWKTEHVKEHIAKFTDPGIKDEVLAAWKLWKAYPLAQKRAEALVESAKDKKDLRDALKGQTVAGDQDGKELKVEETTDFSWLTMGLPSPNMRQQPRATLSSVLWTKDIDQEFMQVACEDLKVGEVGYAPNRDHSMIYVIRVVHRGTQTGDDLTKLRDTFMKEQLFESFPDVPAEFRHLFPPPVYAQIASSDSAQLYFDWLESLKKKHQITWTDELKNY